MHTTYTYQWTYAITFQYLQKVDLVSYHMRYP